MKAAKQGTLRDVSHTQITLDLQGLELIVNGEKISITVPTAALPPLIEQDARQALVDAGLAPLEVDVLAENLYEEVQDRLLSRLLASRRQRG